MIVELGVVAIAGLWILRRLYGEQIRSLVRRILILIGLRRITPRDGERRPSRLTIVPALDTGGGAYRPKHRPQDPSKDPQEPYGSESSSAGNDHGWSGCTMSSSADALAYATRGERTPWGGDMRHRQGDLSGGTDLYDAADAFAAYGEKLYVKSGAGWGAVVDAHEAGRAIVIQGTGQVPGAGDFDGGHACCIGTETHSDGRWLFGDPLCTDWQWIEPSAIKSWAQRWQSSIAFAQTVVVPANGEPEPPEPPDSGGTDTTPYGPKSLDQQIRATQPDAVRIAIAHREDAYFEAWCEWLSAPAPGPADRWGVGAWSDLLTDLLVELDEGVGPDPCEPGAPGRWSRGELPSPAREVIAALDTPRLWGASSWPSLWPSGDSPA